MPIGAAWDTFLETPLVNVMVALSVVTFGSFGFAILVFTVISRVVLFPLTLRTLHAARRMQELQPQLQEIQKKYSDPRRRSEETMKLYRESGVNPLGCLGPQLVQFPVFIALYQVIRATIATTPESVIELSDRLYDFDILQNAIPLTTHFFFMDLQKDGNLFLVLFVFASMWLQQRISSSRQPSGSTQAAAQQQQMQAMMQWMMPAMFAWIVMVVPAGLALYWAASTVIGIVLQWIFVGPGDFTWGSLVPAPLRGSLGIDATPRPTARGRRGRGTAPVGTPDSATDHPSDQQSDHQQPESRNGDARSGNQRQERRRGSRQGSRPARSSSRSGRRRRHPRGQ